MQVFKTAVRTTLRHPIYLMVYAVFLSFMGVFMASGISFGGDKGGEFIASDTEYSIIDRDSSDLAEGMASYLATQGIEVELADNKMALQDAVAKNESAYILIVDEGFGASFMESARSGADLPSLQTVYSYYSSEGSLIDQKLGTYLNAARAFAATDKTASQREVADRAYTVMEESVPVDVISTGNSTAESQRFLFYLEWGTYTLFASITVCVGVLMTTLNRTDLRRRNLVSPVSRTSFNLQTAAGSLFIMTVVWLWTVALGLAMFYETIAQISALALAVLIALSFVFATIPLAVGFLLGQLGLSEFASNAIGNIAGMVVSFLGGVWISFDLLSPSMQVIARFTPAYWYVDALQQAINLTETSPAVLTSVIADAGVMLLFTGALFATALVAGRMRIQSAESGGNAGAALTAL